MRQDFAGGGTFSNAVREAIVRNNTVASVLDAQLIPLSAVTPGEERRVAAYNLALTELRSLVNESRPSDFDAKRALRALGEGGLLTNPKRRLIQLLTTRKALAQEFNRSLKAFRNRTVESFTPIPLLKNPDLVIE